MGKAIRLRRFFPNAELSRQRRYRRVSQDVDTATGAVRYELHAVGRYADAAAAYSDVLQAIAPFGETFTASGRNPMIRSPCGSALRHSAGSG